MRRGLFISYPTHPASQANQASTCVASPYHPPTPTNTTHLRGVAPRHRHAHALGSRPPLAQDGGEVRTVRGPAPNEAGAGLCHLGCVMFLGGWGERGGVSVKWVSCLFVCLFVCVCGGWVGGGGVRGPAPNEAGAGLCHLFVLFCCWMGFVFVCLFLVGVCGKGGSEG